MCIKHRLTERSIQHPKVTSNYRENSNYTNYIQPGNSVGGEFFLNCLGSAIINYYNRDSRLIPSL